MKSTKIDISSPKQPIRLLPILIVSLISGLVVITYQISFGSLIFSGSLAPYLASGIGFCLMGVVLVGAIEALLSGTPGMVAIPTAGSAAILAAVATGLANDLGSTPDVLFPTVTAAITAATLLTGITFLVLGQFNLGNFIRYFPYPVIGGFLAGTGWLVISGALKTMSGLTLNFRTLSEYSEQDVLIRWLPGVAFGIVLLLVMRRYKHYLITPLMILGAIVFFYLVMWLTNTSLAEAANQGLLFPPFPSGALWRPPPLSELAVVNWEVIFRQTGEIISLILISSITLLLYASGVEVTTGREINLNQELRACGVGNLAAAFSASPPGYVIVTMSVLSNKLGANHRLVGLLVAAISAGIMFFGGPVIALFPKPVLGGVLTYLGLTFLVDWLFDGWRRLSHANYLIVVIILLAMSLFGLLPGLGVGLALAAGLFILEYSRVPVIRHVLSGRSYRSRVERSQPQAELLRREGQGLIILDLQGYLFFGTANRIYEQIKEMLTARQAQPPRGIVLDFRRVTGLDASAASSFVRIKRLFQKHNIFLVFSQLPDQIQDQLKRDVLTQIDQKTWRVFPDLDRAIEWFEEELFHSEVGMQADIQAKLGAVQVGQERGGLALLFAALMEEAERDHLDENQGLLLLMQYLERLELADGETLINQGDSHPYLYFLDAGGLTIEHYRESNQPVRLETSGPGAVVGELSFYLNIPAPATVKASASSVVFRLSAENLQHLEHENPRAANLLHRFLLKRNGQRLLTIFEIVEALSD